MFPHATRHPRGVRSSTIALVLPAIIVLLAFLALPSGHALARTHTKAEQAVQSFPPGPNDVIDGVGSVSYNNDLYDFVVQTGNYLWVDYWNGSSWQWADQGTPA